MGVADNKTYRDQSPYFSPFKAQGKDYPSLDDEDQINSTIKENPYRSNVNIEGDEIVLQPDMTGLFKAIGKKHTKGGMDVLLKPNSFIFSDYKGLALGEKDHKMFELKEGGNFNPDKNTPAEVLKRNVNVKHYNTLVNNVNDPKKDDIAKQSSLLMLQKYIQTLGNIAYIQEEKKKFPDGVPDFAQNTAPVYDGELKNDIMEQKQFRKYGGNVFQDGGTSRRPRNPNAYYDPIKGLWYNQKPQNFWDLQQQSPLGPPFNVNSAQAEGSFVPQSNTTASTTPQGKYSGVPPVTDYSGVPPAKGYSTIIPDVRHPSVPSIQEMGQLSSKDVLNPNSVSGKQGIKTANWEFTPWQKLSQLYNWGQYANAKRYMPYRSQYNATYAEPTLLNPEQTINDARGAANQQISSLNTLNPIMRNAQASSAYGQLLNQIPGIRTQYDNQNAQISNQFKEYNNQVKNNETMTNLGFDQQYYQQAIEGRKNFDNLKSYTANNAMSETMGDVSTDQRLAYNLLSQDNPAYGYNWKTGNLYRNPKSILDAQTNSKSDYYTQLAGQIQQKISQGQDVPRGWWETLKALSLGKIPFTPEQTTPFKKGGKVKNPYKY